VLYLIEHQILLPGLSVLSRLVRQARREENARLHTHLAARIPTTVHADLVNLLRVHDDSRFSELERLRTEPDRVSSPGMVQALDRTSRGELKQRYRQGLEDQLGALGLVLNAVVWWNSLYIDAAVTSLRADGFPATEEMCARLSPLGFDHINFLGSYTFPTNPAVEGLRPLRDPEQSD
jgi:hypothetical protein